MSKFKVEVKTISEVIRHPNADRLVIYKVDGIAYQFISNKVYQVDDQVVYFPIDSVMPPELIELFELGTMLAGKDHNRVKTVRLRKEYSQGFIADDITIAEYLKVPPTNLVLMDLTEALGVTKWEPPPTPCKNGDLVSLPPGLSMYDIEGCDNYPDLVQHLIDHKIPVTITEKLEGQNFSVTVDKEGKQYVSQRRFSIVEREEGGMHDMWEVARREGILDLAQKILEDQGADDVTIYGEHCGPGVQGNYYDLKERTVWFFDMKINGMWVSDVDLRPLLKEFDALDKLVPVLGTEVQLDEWLDGQPVNQASYGKSVINNQKLREGIVIKPSREMVAPNGLGRLILKQRDQTYLCKTDY